ncbi:2Fe-2S iron-sulfur cluster-binding protein [Actinoplanes subtropicus]|uniref:2Fe-2S iron-sulfur cluster-binding protein n=1 Tax=Actinoplanes subtropicus TaxID=543632 RepID=UPI0004C45A4B|nr:2Fe-2S iron-sulfur cluster-binding protein [Actinoplanes subtropicus]
MTTSFRTAAGGRIDRSRPLRFTFDGRTYTGYAGDTLASALLANGVHRVATSIRYGRPRGIVTAGVAEPSAIVQIEAPFPEPMLAATAIELYDGLVARGLAGQGRLADKPDPARYDATHAHCEVLVVGAGPAGLTAALTAARAGVRVVIVDEQPEPGGALLGTDDRPALDWFAAVAAELRANPDVRFLRRCTAFGYYDDGFVLALEVLDPERTRQRVWRIRAKQVVVATGAHERPVVFAGNDRPGIMQAGAARTYLHRYGVLAGRRAAVFTTNDSAYPAAVELADAGVAIAGIVDPRDEIPAHWRAECERRGIAVHSSHVVTGTSGSDRVTRAHLAPLGGGPRSGLECDVLLVSGGWNPAVHLFSQARGALRFDEALGAFLPGGTVEGVRVAGSAAGVFELAACRAEGAARAAEALSELGVPAALPELPAVPPAPAGQPARVLWRVPGDEPERQFVDLQRDATAADVLQAVGAGLRSVEHVKRYTTISTAHDQGKTSGVVASGIVAEQLGVPVGDLGTTTFRPPYTPVAFAALAGRNTGELHDPVRVTSLHPWHVEHGALFENVGQWKRPWYYPHAGEDLTAAVLRECRAAREGVAMMDASTLGKIDVQGRDAGVLLDRLYTNLMSTLKVGSARYGVMCGVDGMVKDDGTVIRVDENRWLLTTTTGNAAMVLEWMEEWLQTEWPHLQVSLTSVTEHWATVALVGPRSREVLAQVAPGLDVGKEAFPFMSWRDATVAGIPARVCRISFSGELAYEINVNAWYGRALWEALLDAGEPLGITPYGTETMHVLRAEKGYPIIGQDTDGTVTPQDLGMSWIVSKKKPDFVGKRSFDRTENQRADRKHLVGLLPADGSTVLAEGAQILTNPDTPPMLGHVTSSYRSAALGRPFALALVRAGRDRIGETLHAWHDGASVPVTVTGPVLYDSEGARRDG